MFKIEAQKEINVNKEEEKKLIKQQLVAIFHTATVELEKADKKANSAIQPDNNRHVPNMWLSKTDWAKHFTELNSK